MQKRKQLKKQKTKVANTADFASVENDKSIDEQKHTLVKSDETAVKPCPKMYSEQPCGQPKCCYNLPRLLRNHLIYDHQMIIFEGLVPRESLPASPNIEEVLNSWNASMTWECEVLDDKTDSATLKTEKQREKMKAEMDDVIGGIKMYLDYFVKNKVLFYSGEEEKYNNKGNLDKQNGLYPIQDIKHSTLLVSKSSKKKQGEKKSSSLRPSLMYGTEHLLRVIAWLPSIMPQENKFGLPLEVLDVMY